jgi:hypothetical protein
MSLHVSRFTFHTFSIFYLLFSISSHAATVFGNLTDISLAPLNTKLLFSPTNVVLVSPSGLSAGPPRLIDTTAGAFSLTLDAGDYTVSLPLLAWRHSFCISVPQTPASINITNLLCSPVIYTYTNRFIPPLHVNTSRVTVLCTDGTATLLDSPATISGGFLSPGNTITIEACGSFADPGASIPHAVFTLKLGSVTIVTTASDVTSTGWHLRAAITVRTTGTTGTAVGSIAVIQDNPATGQFPITSATATVNTTTSLAVDLLASIANLTGSEAVVCDQLTIHLE